MRTVASEPREEQRHRRRATSITALVGTVVLAWGLNVEQGSPWFYAATASLAAVWLAGACWSGPIPLGHSPIRPNRSGVPEAIAVGVGMAVVFVVGALVVQAFPPLAGPVTDVLGYARAGVGPVVWLIAVVNGVAEEVFFRGALYSALRPRFRAVGVTTAYALVTAASGNVMLTFAAVCVGMVTVTQRRLTGGVLAPVVTHVTWSLVMLAVLPRVFVVPRATMAF